LAGSHCFSGWHFCLLQRNKLPDLLLVTVMDQQGAVVNTAKVKATNVDTGFTRTAR
jgi:hypothetical protein